MAILQNDPEINHKLLAILDELIENPCWDKSLFLKATSKELSDFHNKLSESLVLELPKVASEEQQDGKKTTESTATIPEGKQEVYVGLYQNEGMKLANWEKSLELLIKNSSSRPIYAQEVKAKDMLVKQGNNPNLAYIAILVDKDAVVAVPEKLITDRFGHELLTLREDALRLDNIRRFNHVSGVYKLDKKNRLVKL